VVFEQEFPATRLMESANASLARESLMKSGLDFLTIISRNGSLNSCMRVTILSAHRTREYAPKGYRRSTKESLRNCKETCVPGNSTLLPLPMACVKIAFLQCVGAAVREDGKKRYLHLHN
jgi:hypothetical protein